jgi:hypothetical protein
MMTMGTTKLRQHVPTTSMLTLLLAVCPVMIASFSTRQLPLPALARRSQQQLFYSSRITSTTSQLSATTSTVETTETSDTDAAAAITDFESWFAAYDKNYCNPAVAHTIFGVSLRGLEWKKGAGDSGAMPDKEGAKAEICRVPASMVLQSNFQKSDWDAQLACQLWTECCSGKSSQLSGYTRLLLGSTTKLAAGDPCPESTSPNALRHWSPAQRELLASSTAGQQLLDLEERQQLSWRKKFDQLNLASQAKFSWPQFLWAMEVVHSRAFRGQNFETSLTSIIPSLLAPILVAAAGWQYNFSVAEPSYTVLGALAVAATLPILFSLILGTPPSTAVLLPLIDSANHIETADSSIVFDPLRSCFQLQCGPKCFVAEGDDDSQQKRTQLFVSYGPKTDTELLLNYGFLPNVPCSEGNGEAVRDQQRRRLAEAFQARSS